MEDSIGRREIEAHEYALRREREHSYTRCDRELCGCASLILTYLTELAPTRLAPFLRILTGTTAYIAVGDRWRTSLPETYYRRWQISIYRRNRSSWYGE